MYNILALRFELNRDKKEIYKKLNLYTVEIYELINNYRIIAIVLQPNLILDTNLINRINPLSFRLYTKNSLVMLNQYKYLEIDCRGNVL